MKTLIRRTLELIDPHRRAERLMDVRIDSRRDGLPIDEKEDAWLNTHLDGCSTCQQAWADRRAAVDMLQKQSSLMAPDGFAERVLRAARQEAMESEPAEPKFGLAWPTIVAAGAIAAMLVVGLGPGRTFVTSAGQIAVSGTSQALPNRPADLRVRAPGLGAAKARSEVTRIAKDRGLSVAITEHAVRLEIPRAQLVSVLQELAQRGPYTVDSQGDEPPPPEQTHLVVDVIFED